MNPAIQPKDRNRLLNVLFFGALLTFMVIAVLVHLYLENQFDSHIQELLRPLATPALLNFWIRVSFFGSFEFLFSAYLIFILFNVWKRKARFGLSVAGVAIGGFLSVQLVKMVVQRHRPPAPLVPNFTDYSFPSGHTASSFIFCAVLTYFLWHSNIPRSLKNAGIILLILLTCFTGLSRIVLAVHYPTDVAAGFCLGILWSISWYRFIQKKN